MDWIDRLQERIAITRTEGIALITVTGLFLSGLLIQQVWELQATVPEGYYAATDSAFAAVTRNLSASSENRSHIRSDTTDTTDTTAQQVSSPGAGVRMDLNAANARQLQQLSGIGPVLAKRITAYRKQNGPFARLEDLIEVSGIGPKTFENIRTFLYVEEAPKDE